MATVRITNQTAAEIYLPSLQVNLDPGQQREFVRYLPEMEAMPDLMQLYESGDITVDILTIESWELLWRRLTDTTEVTRTWPFQTNQTTQYAGGYYDFGSTDDDFSPSINFGTVTTSRAAHIFVVTGAVPVNDVTIRVTGTRIQDTGVQTTAFSEDIVVPAGTPANSYFEWSKFNGRVTIETVSGTPIVCNYGWAKYHDFNNQDFELLGLEAVWESDSTDSSSDIALLHHKATGWTFNSSAEPTPPTPVAARSTDHSGQNDHLVGSGAWKRTGLGLLVHGFSHHDNGGNGGNGGNEGILFRVTSGTTGVGTLSFRSMSLEVTLRKIPEGTLA